MLRRCEKTRQLEQSREGIAENKHKEIVITPGGSEVHSQGTRLCDLGGFSLRSL